MIQPSKCPICSTASIACIDHQPFIYCSSSHIGCLASRKQWLKGLQLNISNKTFLFHSLTLCLVHCPFYRSHSISIRNKRDFAANFYNQSAILSFFSKSQQSAKVKNASKRRANGNDYNKYERKKREQKRIC